MQSSEIFTGTVVPAESDYAEMARRPLDAEQCALIVVDVQEKLLPPIWEKDRFVRNVQLLTRLARTLKIPALVTVQYAKGLGNTVPEIAALLPDTTPIDKLTFSCFGSDAFCSLLKRLPGQRTTVLLCGMETHICVMQTALGALREGYLVHVASDAVELENRIKLANRPRSHARRGSHSLLHRNDDLRIAAHVGSPRVSGTIALFKRVATGLAPSPQTLPGRCVFLLHPHHRNLRKAFFKRRSLQLARHLAHDIFRHRAPTPLVPFHANFQRNIEEQALHIVAIILGQLDPAMAVMGRKVGSIHVVHWTPRNQPCLQHRPQIGKNEILKALLLGVIEKKFAQQIAR